jgi:hypothetical protein
VALRRELPALRVDAGVVDQQVDRAAGAVQGAGETADRVQVGQVQLVHLEVPGELSPDALALGDVADGHQDGGAMGGELPGGDPAEAAARAGHHRDAAGLVGHVIEGPGLGHDTFSSLADYLSAPGRH